MAYDEDLAERVRELVAPEGADERRMFGGLAFLVDGNMAVTVSGRGGLLVRAGPDAGTLVTDGVRQAVMGSREMRGWLEVAAAAVEDPRQLAQWVTRGVTYARSLPPKPGH